MAVRRNLLDEGLADEWSRMFCEDAHTINYLRRKGAKLVYVPEATIPNREDVSVASCIRFVNRQMLIFRLYNRNWNWLVLSIFLAASLRITHDLLIVKALILTDFFSLACLVCCHPLILLVTRYEVSRLDRIVRQTVKNQGQVIPSNPLPDLFGYFCVEIVFLTSVIAALFTQFAVWRGIRYRIRGPEEITLLGYSPYQQPDADPVVAEVAAEVAAEVDSALADAAVVAAVVVAVAVAAVVVAAGVVVAAAGFGVVDVGVDGFDTAVDVRGAADDAALVDAALVDAAPVDAALVDAAPCDAVVAGDADVGCPVVGVPDVGVDGPVVSLAADSLADGVAVAAVVDSVSDGAPGVLVGATTGTRSVADGGTV